LAAVFPVIEQCRVSAFGAIEGQEAMKLESQEARKPKENGPCTFSPAIYSLAAFELPSLLSFSLSGSPKAEALYL
jgi:hypothetical protein